MLRLLRKKLDLIPKKYIELYLKVIKNRIFQYSLRNRKKYFIFILIIYIFYFKTNSSVMIFNLKR